MNFRRVPVIQGDVREPDTASRLLRAAGLREGELDLLAGCPPCQGFSEIRTKRRGAVEDARNSLVLDFLRLVREIRPRLVLMENVPGLAADDLFREFTAGIAACGMLYDSGVLDGADFGTHRSSAGVWCSSPPAARDRVSPGAATNGGPCATPSPGSRTARGVRETRCTTTENRGRSTSVPSSRRFPKTAAAGPTCRTMSNWSAIAEQRGTGTAGGATSTHAWRGTVWLRQLPGGASIPARAGSCTPKRIGRSLSGKLCCCRGFLRITKSRCGTASTPPRRSSAMRSRRDSSRCRRGCFDGFPLSPRRQRHERAP